MDPWSVGLGGASLLMGGKQNSQANDAANAALANQNAVLGDVRKGYSGLTDLYNQQVSQGVYDPTQALKNSAAAADLIYGRDTGNAASAAKIMGYRAGDTAPLDDINAIRANEQLAYQQYRNNLISQYADRQFAAKQATVPVGELGAGQQYGGQAQLQYSRLQDPSGLLGGLSQYAMQQSMARQANQDTGTQGAQGPYGSLSNPATTTGSGTVIGQPTSYGGYTPLRKVAAYAPTAPKTRYQPLGAF